MNYDKLFKLLKYKLNIDNDIELAKKTGLTSGRRISTLRKGNGKMFVCELVSIIQVVDSDTCQEIFRMLKGGKYETE